jgi:hypothetical protein
MSSTVCRLSGGLIAAAATALLAASAMSAPVARVTAGLPKGAALESADRANPRAARMSGMGAKAAAAVERVKRDAAASKGGIKARVDAVAENAAGNPAARQNSQDDDGCVNTVDCEGGYREGPRGGQAEISIAVDSTGQHIVVGFNDQRGFALNPLSVSGFMYSDDGGNTFVDGGQLPSPGDTNIGGTLLPQVFGDPEVKYLGDCTFVYSSIILAANADTVAAQTMGVHRSTDCGHTWTGPYEVVAATNPEFLGDAADKEFMDVDPDTGRLMITWTNFRADGNVDIDSAFSDDGGLTWPGANRRTISGDFSDGQSSIPRFAGNGSPNVYAAWRRFPFPGDLFGYGNTVGFARSTDNGNSWEPISETSAEFLTQDYILGNDRSNTSPSLAVDNSHGRYRGNIYLVYPNNDSQDGSDIVFQRSSNGGQTFSAPLLLNSRPGADRPQWFPSVAVDNLTGRVSVFYYDQGIASSGDLSEVTYTFSYDGGKHWSKPRPLTFQPFHAGHNNDTGQPNLGDYIQGVSLNGAFFAGFALANRPELGFVDGQPDGTLTGIDATVRRVGPFEHLANYASLNVGNVTFTDSGHNGYIDPGETADITVPLYNYVTNPLNKGNVRAPLGILVSDTPGVSVLKGLSTYGTITPGATRSNSKSYRIRVNGSVAPGTPINLRLLVLSFDGIATLKTQLDTGTPVATTLLSENFEGVAPGSLPVGWTAAHGAGAFSFPWTTNNTFCGGVSNGAFQPNNDPGSPRTRWERLLSPAFAVPANAAYVTVEFDVCTDSEDDPVLTTTAYDGVFLRVTDLTPGHTLRSVLAEAFEDEFTTGGIQHYPRHLPRNSNGSYFEDMSAWGGDSGGVKHVRMRLPGMQGSIAQLRFEFTQDSFATCLDVRPGSAGCGVFVDNVVVKSVVK